MLPILRLWPFLLPASLFAQQPAGTVLATWPLAAGNTAAWGLAFRGGPTQRLYVADENDNEIYVYQRTATGLVELPSEHVFTSALDADFTAPRGVAFEPFGGTPYLYVLTSHDGKLAAPPAPDRDYASRLWRVDLDTNAVDWLDLDHPNFGIVGLPVHGLEVAGGFAYVSYDTTPLTAVEEPARKGILRLRVAVDAASWSRARRGFGAPRHLPHSGRVTNVTAADPDGVRSPCFGLALHTVNEESFLWGTSYNKYLYVQEAEQGRGLFHIDSPGDQNIYGVAAGDGRIFVVDRISGADQIHELAPGITCNDAVAKNTTVRHLRLELESVRDTLTWSDTVQHNFATPPATSYRPNQGRDYASFTTSTSRPALVTTIPYDPAGDTSARCYPIEVRYDGMFAAGLPVHSAFDCDVWTSFRRHFVYPHRCNTVGTGASGYTADDWDLYRLSDGAAYTTFVAAVQAAMAAEYGASASATSNPYWIARNVLEYVMEHYDYGNTNDLTVGHRTYHPANFKVELPFDGVANNELMSCSTTTFAMSAVMRWHGLPTRWVATTRRRALADPDGNGFWDNGEQVLDDSYHRWCEVWLGSNYGWQRFDATPMDDGPREMSQFELSSGSACGVDERDLVLHVGSNVVTMFYKQEAETQWYNGVARYGAPTSWSTTRSTYAVWTNPCSLAVLSATAVGGTATVTWTTSGPWSLDYYGRLVVTDASGNALSGEVLWSAGGLSFATSGLTAGSHALKLVKVDDPLTGVDFTLVVP